MIVDYIIGQSCAINPQKLHISTPQPGTHIFGKQDDPGICGTLAALVIKPQGRQLQRNIAMVFLNNLARDGLIAIILLKQRQRQIVQRAFKTWLSIKSSGRRNPPVNQRLLILLAGHPASWPNANMHTALVAHRRLGGGLDGDNRNVALGCGQLFHSKRG
ncbi:MAG: hypothetical protein POG24_08815 [Acidocella sp.]|nr:hypothetical protein [Acidocella sp.]